MTLTKKDLGQIKGAVKETMAEAMVSEPIKKVLKDTVFEVMEPMMVASQKEFTNIGERFEKIDERFDRVDERFEKIDERFEKIDERFDKVDERFDKVDERFEKVEEEIKVKFDKVLMGQDKILNDLEDLKSDNIASLEAYKRQEGKIENHEIRIKIVEKKLDIAAAR